MMDSSTLRIYECQSCNGIFSQLIAIDEYDGSKNMIWTDGEPYQSIPYPKDHYFSLCDCGSFVWIERSKLLDEFETEDKSFYDNLKKWNNSKKKLHTPSEEDYLNALNIGVYQDIMEEMYLRVKAWRVCNDAFRREIIINEAMNEQKTQEREEAREREQELRDIKEFNKFECRKESEKMKDSREFLDIVKMSDDDFSKLADLFQELNPDTKLHISEKEVKLSRNHVEVKDYNKISVTPARSEWAKKNMEMIAKKLKNGRESEQLMQAEILRELECFDESIKLLNSKFLRDYLPYFSDKIRGLSEKKISLLAKVKRHSSHKDNPFFVSPSVLFPDRESPHSKLPRLS